MTKQSYKERERQRREDDILNSAEQLFLERGYTNLNMDDLASEVGISKPTLYQHFKSKDDLAVRILLRSYQSMNDYLTKPLDEPAIERLIGLIRRSLTVHAPMGIIMSLRGDMRPESVWKMVHSYPELADCKSHFKDALFELINQAKKEGSIDADIPTPIVSRTLMTLNHSLSDPTLQAEIAINPESLESAMNSVIRVFLHGVTPLPEIEPNTL